MAMCVTLPSFAAQGSTLCPVASTAPVSCTLMCPVGAQASVTFALAILAEAALSYLGLGTPPTTPSWGRMLMDAQTYLFNAPLQALWPGLAIAVAVLGFNLVGDGLRDFLDPRLRDVA